MINMVNEQALSSIMAGAELDRMAPQDYRDKESDLAGGTGALEVIKHLTQIDRPRELKLFDDFFVTSGRLVSTTYLDDEKQVDEEMLDLQLAMCIYSMEKPASEVTVTDLAYEHELMTQARLGLHRSIGMGAGKSNLIKDMFTSVRQNIHSFTDQSGGQPSGGGIRRFLGKIGFG